MSADRCALFAPPACTACDPRAAATPLPLENRPGLATLRYRAGTFETFRQAMLDRMVVAPVAGVDPNDPARRVTTLTTFDSGDYGIAMLELWAYVCAVLTFYQQAYANEAFLRTSTLRESLVELAALVGYEPLPGVAATALLAFFADPGEVATLPAGLQVQSVPAPGGEPQTFELSSKLTIAAPANQPVLFGPPRGAVLGTGVQIVGAENAADVTPGTALVFFDPASETLYGTETVTAVTATTLGAQVEWRGDMGSTLVSAVTAYRYERTFRWYGSNAPLHYLAIAAAGGSVSYTDVWMNTDGTVNDPTESFFVGYTATIELDGTYEGLARGGKLLVAYAHPSGSYLRLVTIVDVRAGASQRGQLSGPCTVVTIDPGLPPANDGRYIAVYELLGDAVVLAPDAFGASFGADDPSGATTIYVDDASAIGKGTRLLVVSGTGAAQISDVVTASAAPSAAGPPYAVTVTPPLAHRYLAAETRLFANLATATAGETQTEQVLGDGDASQPFQEFVVAKNPVTYVPDASAASGASSTLQVFVDGIAWTEVPSLYARAPDETVFETFVGDDGKRRVRTGDGVHGRRPATGSENVRARLRAGLGSEGDVGAGTITTLVQTVPGVSGVENPVPAYGGADEQRFDAIRRDAPSSVLTLGRIVSLRDYEAFALTYAGIAKARASWADIAEARGVALTVATAGEAPLGPLARPLRDFLDRHRDPNVALAVSSATRLPFALAVTVHVRAGRLLSVVSAALAAAVGPSDAHTGFLDDANLPLGETLFLSEIVAALQQVEGVEWVAVDAFAPNDASRGYGGVAPPVVVDAILVGPTEVAAPVRPDDTTGIIVTWAGGIDDMGGAA
jgi:uncharacterized phage protein gp47/JayE